MLKVIPMSPLLFFRRMNLKVKLGIEAIGI